MDKESNWHKALASADTEGIELSYGRHIVQLEVLSLNNHRLLKWGVIKMKREMNAYL